MTLTIELRPFVREFAELIELKLRANEHKKLGGVSSHFLYTKLMEDVHKLFEANQRAHENNYYTPNKATENLAHKVALEAANVASAAGFFAARIKALTDPGVHEPYPSGANILEIADETPEG